MVSKVGGGGEEEGKLKKVELVVEELVVSSVTCKCTYDCSGICEDMEAGRRMSLPGMGKAMITAL